MARKKSKGVNLENENRRADALDISFIVYDFRKWHHSRMKVMIVEHPKV